MKINQLGQTGILVSELCFGTLVMGPLQANLSIQDGSELLSFAFDLGINFFDMITPTLGEEPLFISRDLICYSKLSISGPLRSIGSCQRTR